MALLCLPTAALPPQARTVAAAATPIELSELTAVGPLDG